MYIYSKMINSDCDIGKNKYTGVNYIKPALFV